MITVTLGRTGIQTNKNGFGALPIQRADMETAKVILRKALQNGVTFYDTARAYTDSEEKIGQAFEGMRDQVFLATKTTSTTVEGFWKDLNQSLETLRTGYADIYQFHNPAFCPKPGDGTGLYEAMLEAREKGMIRFISISNHRLAVAQEAVESGLYDTLQFPFSYLSGNEEIALVNLCKERNVGFLAMKALAGGLINNGSAAYEGMKPYDNVLPIWGIQHEHELDDFIACQNGYVDPKAQSIINDDQQSLRGSFCRGCGYCMATCPAKIDIFMCARMSRLIRRSPSAPQLSPEGQARMMKIEDCIECGICKTKCPYGLDIPTLLKENLKDYKEILAGKPL